MSAAPKPALLGLALLAGSGLLLGVDPTAAEPHFLAKQYARCQTCHYSASGGGLLTEYGRMLSRQELSTTGRSPKGVEPSPGEERFLFGALGDALGPVQLGLNLRPAHLRIRGVGFSEDRNFWMRADLQAAVQLRSWTLYSEIGREPVGDRGELNAYEYWARHDWENGSSLRFGRFFPAFGVRFADHTTYTRRGIGLDRNSQIYGIELADAGERHHLQFDLSPGFARSIIDDDGTHGFIGSLRTQFDLTNRQVLVLSGMYRGETDRQLASWFGSVAYGISPHPRLNLWTELVERVSDGWDGTPEYTIVNETSFELVRGLWIKFSPQLQTELNNVSGGTWRLAFNVDWLPRTHWNLVSTWTRDVVRQQDDFHIDTWMIQLHLYL